jgi:ABC-type branched-subunit amino acid transport system ATPase component
MLTNLKKFLELLSSVEKKKLIILMFMILIMALVDMLGVASIMPFMAVLANPELIETNKILAEMYLYSRSADKESFFFILGLIVFFILVFSLFFKGMTTYFQIQFAMMCEYTIGKRFIEGYIHQPYVWFLNRHSAELGKNILSEVQTVILNVVMPFITIFSQGAVVIAIFVLLLFIDTLLSLSVCFFLGLFYFGIYKIMRQKLSAIGQSRLDANEGRFTAVIETFAASKEIKIGNHEDVCIKRFSNPAKIYAKQQITAEVISTLPRFMFEAIAFGGLMLVILYLMNNKGNFSNSIPIITLYAFAGYRLMPALQFIYRAVSQIRFAEASLNFLYNDLIKLKKLNLGSRNFNIIKFEKDIQLKNITFKYPNSDNLILKKLSLKILAKNVVALVGKTGSGKTTIVDLIMGILDPLNGTLEVDGNIIDSNNCKSWQKIIGYVPQQIYLANDTIEANIAFGIDVDKINFLEIERSAKIANLHEFVTNQLPEGYKTFVGERGIRLSGGQRQRIGIARALYHNPKVLIMDEATSALDGLTEKAIMQTINELRNDITIIIIAHRLSTVRECDQIYLVDDGKIIAQGNFLELIQKNDIFSSMVSQYKQ